MGLRQQSGGGKKQAAQLPIQEQVSPSTSQLMRMPNSPKKNIAPAPLRPHVAEVSMAIFWRNHEKILLAIIALLNS
jgi:hypothetical protein